ncbi:transglycosylase SLT domain-containing protein [Streptomyces sp. NPDC053048]|uniref:transglycosylase SLT domain-containing protein n=1 Tax=Streptomyces sp. NPDC053048 TaxID=3365694 RepID=UPI0037D0B78C
MRSTISGYTRLPKAHKISAAAIAAAGTAALAFAVVPNASAADLHSAAVKPVAQNAHEFGETQAVELAQLTDAAAEQAKAAAAARTGDAAKADAERASRSTERQALKPAAPAKKAYADNLDGWIKESLDVLKSKGIPASYEGIKRNIMRESTGNPRAINNWDVNAVNGVPSKGLLQIIDPTFKAYHVEGTSWDIYDPVANITASCNYAADKYGSMDNVNSAY